MGGGKEKELKKKNEGRASITLTFLLKPGKVYSGRAGGRGSLLQRIRLKKPSIPTPARHSRGFPRQPPGEEPARTFFVPYPTIPVPKSPCGVIFPWLAGPNTQQNKGKGGNAAPSGPRSGAQSCFCSPRWGADPGGEAPRSQPLPSLTPQKTTPPAASHREHATRTRSCAEDAVHPTHQQRGVLGTDGGHLPRPSTLTLQPQAGQAQRERLAAGLLFLLFQPVQDKGPALCWREKEAKIPREFEYQRSSGHPGFRVRRAQRGGCKSPFVLGLLSAAPSACPRPSPLPAPAELASPKTIAAYVLKRGCFLGREPGLAALSSGE